VHNFLATISLPLPLATLQHTGYLNASESSAYSLTVTSYQLSSYQFYTEVCTCSIHTCSL